MKARILSSEKPGLFWIRTSPYPSSYTDLLERISQCNKDKISNSQLSTHSLVVVQKNQKWLRAVMLNTEARPLVWLIDVGQQYTAEEVFRAPNRLFKQPPLAQPFCLMSFLPNESNEIWTSTNWMGRPVKLSSSYELNGILIGNFMIEINGKEVSMRELMINMKYGIECAKSQTENFLREKVLSMDNLFKKINWHLAVEEEKSESLSDDEYYSCSSIIEEESESSQYSYNSCISSTNSERRQMQKKFVWDHKQRIQRYDTGSSSNGIIRPKYFESFINCKTSSKNLKIFSKNDGDNESKPKAAQQFYIEPTWRLDMNETQIFANQNNLFLSRVVCRGNGPSFEPICDKNELKLEYNIRKHIPKSDLLHPIQCYAIPAIQEGNHVVLVDPSQPIKILSYVIPIINYFNQLKFELSMLPRCVIVCSSFNSVQLNLKYFKLITDHCRPLKVVTLFERNEDKAVVDMINGCHVLISTIHALMRLLKFDFVNFLENVEYMVIDDADKLTNNKFYLKFVDFFKVLKSLQKVRKVQTIVSTEQITFPVKRLIKYLSSKNFFLISTALLENAIFYNVEVHSTFIKLSEKNEEFIKIMRHYVGVQNTVICCRSSSEVLEVHNLFQCGLVAHEKTLKTQIDEVGYQWQELKKKGVNPLLICSDEVLSELTKITGVEVVSHYNLSSHSKSLFGRRFLFFRDMYHNPFVGEEPKKLVTVIFIDERNDIEMPDTLDWLARMGLFVPQEFIDTAKEIRRARELLKCKENVNLCSRLIAFGECNIHKDCVFRHAFDRNVDKINESEYIGQELILQLTAVETASIFSARVVGVPIGNGKYTKISSDLKDIIIRLNELFPESQKDEREWFGVPKIGDICGCEDRKGFVSRCQVISVINVDHNGKPAVVNVRLIDQGSTLNVKVIALIKLPENIASIPPQSTRMFIASISPCDHDIDWSPRAKNVLYSMHSRLLSGTEMWRGKVLLSINDCLILDNLRLAKSIEDITIYEVDVIKNLLDANLAVANCEHLPKIIELLREADFEVSLPIAKPSEDTDESKIDELKNKMLAELEGKTDTVIQQKVQWAHFMTDDDHPDLILAKMCLILDFSHVFFQQKKFYDLFLKLREEINKKTSVFYDVVPQVGMYVLAWHEEAHEWLRARVDKIVGNLVTVLSVDYGDTFDVENTFIKKISSKYLEVLPFQAVECSLFGLTHQQIDEKMLDTVSNKFGGTVLMLKIMDSSLTADFTDGRKYSVMMLKEGCDLNKSLACQDDIYAGFDGTTAAAASNNFRDNCDDDSDYNPTEDEERTEFEDKMLVTINKYYDEKGYNDQISESGDDDFKHVEEIIEMVEPHENITLKLSAARKYVKELINSTKEELMLKKTKKAVKEDEPKEYAIKSVQNRDIKESIIHESVQPKLVTNKIPMPRVLWYQTENEIYVEVQIIAAEKYYLIASLSEICFFAQTKDEKMYQLMLNLFGPIFPNSTTVEIKGLNVLIKLIKRSHWLQWHSLVKNAHKFISYKVDAVKVDNEGDHDIDRVNRHVTQAALDSINCETSENEEYESGDSSDDDGA